MLHRFLVALRRSLLRGPAILLVPALVAGLLAVTHGAPRVAAPRTRKAATSAGAGEYVPLTPSRIVDTRTASQPLLAAEKRPFQITGKGGVPTTGVSAVVLVVTGVAPTASGYLTVWPSDVATRPQVSQVNFKAPETAANTVVAKLGADGAINVFNSAGTTDLLLDVTGYYTSSSTTSAGATFVALSPSVLYNTIDGTNTGTYGTAAFGADQTRQIQVTGATMPVPAGAAAVVVNIQATTTSTTKSYVQFWQGGVSTRPTSSNVQLAGSDSQRGLAVVKLSSTGAISAYNYNGSVTLKLAVEGYYLPATSDAARYYVPLNPARIFSTPAGLNTVNGAKTPAGPTSTTSVLVRGAKDSAGRVVVPDTTAVDGVVVSIGASSTTAASTLIAWANGDPRPNTSMIAWDESENRTATYFGRLGASGKIDLYNASGDVALVVDVQGYFANAAVLPPKPPTSVTAVARDGSATVSWTAAVDNGFPLTGNTVAVATAAGAPVATYDEPAAAVAKTVPNLSNGQAYTFTVTARNEGGSTAAAPTAPVTPFGAPLAAETVTAVPGNRSLAVTWTPPPANGSPVTGQTVSLRLASDGSAVVTAAVAVDTFQRDFTGLVNGTRYYVEVVASNAAGTGDPGRSATVAPEYPDHLPYPTAVTGDAPTLYYRLGESGGAVAKDASGWARDALYVAPVTLGAASAPTLGDPDTAVSVGGGGRVQYQAATGLPVGNAARSVELWLKTAASTKDQHLVGWGKNLDNQRFYVWLTGGDQIAVERYGTGARIPHRLPRRVDDNRWHHVVVTYSGAPANRSVVYLDGAEVASATLTDGGLATAVSLDGLAAGREPNDNVNPFSGLLDELAVYDVALAPDRVAAHFAASGITAPLPPPGVVAAAHDGYVDVSWRPTTATVPADGSTAVDGYVVEATTVNGGTLRGRVLAPPTGTSARVSGLPAGDYFVTVAGCNVWGCGRSVATAAVGGGGATYSSLVQDDAPLTYLRFSERTGSGAADSSVNRRDAVYAGGAQRDTGGAIGGDPDPAMGGSAPESLAQSQSGSFLPTGTAPRTVEAWVKGDGAVAGWGPAGYPTRVFGVHVSGRSFVVTGWSDDVSFTTPVPVSDGQWHQVAVTYDGTTVTGYFDGASLGTRTFPAPLNTAATALWVGYVPGMGNRGGAIDDVSVYGTVLTAQRISTHYGAARLAPLAAPDLPVALAEPTVTAQATSAVVTWVPKETVGIVRYEVTVTRRDDGAAVATVPSPAGTTSVTVPGLVRGTSYLFTVRAVNNLGAGPESPVATGTALAPLATLPAGPLGPTVVPRNTGGSDVVWGPEHSPYLVTDLYVDPGDTLTLLPGTVVKLGPTGDGIHVNGQLVAVGTAQRPVVFTSYRDDSVGGDSNHDGTATAPQRKDWSAIAFEPEGPQAGKVSVLDHVEVRYGSGSGGTLDDPGVDAGVVQSNGVARLSVTNSRFRTNVGGVGATSSGWTSVTNSVFEDNTYGVRPAGNADIIGNVFASGVIGIRLTNGGDSVRIAYNDFHITAFGLAHDYSQADIVVTRNNFWWRFAHDAANAFPDVTGNWWGLPIRPPFRRCINTLYDRPEDIDKFWPPVRTGPETSPDECAPNWAPIATYQWQIMPALDAPIATQDTAASSDAAVPTSGPVDTAHGTLRYETTDLALDDAGQSLVLRRMYRSDNGAGVAGKGWSTNYSAKLTKAPNGTSSVDFASGASVRFEPTGQPEAGVPASLTATPGGTTVTAADSSSYEFDAAGVLTAQTLRDPGHRVALTRTDGRVTGVTGVSGRRLTLGYDGAALASATDSAGRHVGYTVAGGLLTGVDRAGGGTEGYGYDGAGRLTSITTPTGRVVLRLEYDAQGRVAWYEQGGAGRVTLEYHPDEHYTVAHQPDGVDVRQEYDGFSRLVRQDVAGGRTNHVAIGVGSVPAVTVNGIPEEGTAFAPEVVAARLDFAGNPVAEVDGEGRTVRTTYDASSRPLTTTYADGGTVTRHYDAKGRVDTVTDPEQHAWAAEYNAFGELTKVTDPLGRANAPSTSRTATSTSVTTSAA
jgi:YD repeat-containing protein